MTPYERLLAEQLPTGTFGDALPPREGPRLWTPLEQAEHRQVLEEALDGFHWQDDTRISAERSALHLVPNQPDQTAA